MLRRIENRASLISSLYFFFFLVTGGERSIGNWVLSCGRKDDCCVMLIFSVCYLLSFESFRRPSELLLTRLSCHWLGRELRSVVMGEFLLIIVVVCKAIALGELRYSCNSFCFLFRFLAISTAFIVCERN